MSVGWRYMNHAGGEYAGPFAAEEEVKHRGKRVVVTEVKTWEIKTDEWLSDEDIAGVAASVADGEDPDSVDLNWEFV